MHDIVSLCMNHQNSDSIESGLKPKLARYGEENNYNIMTPNGQAQRIMFVNGEHDPYLGTTVSAKNRPGGPLVSTPNVPVWIIKNGTNCNDVVVIGNKEANPAFATVITEMVAKMKAWVDEHPSPNWNQVGSALERVLGDGRETNEQLEELTWD
ncbi:hypothetical protein DCS_01049 [Drechmeria coniospora]|uniref:Uncharacterized protein n=1 Tax=Drechmeria coniospora TaxID=98403 RepID=A0A151GS40_DRECN|nr:hypothetical protein DCS_01049 [Drechmeria coniospora]KYK59915.1 hypothetical protein DCS_01049 [Drechmeria coniospora]